MYRSDIDGLRAIAVMGVILFHAEFSWIPGGFAGVDVFFVISGFLIGGIILDARNDQTFTYREFYARRVRRIFPALFAMILATIVAGYFVMMPHDYRYLGGSSLSALLMVSNLWFFNLIDYFNPSAALDPLVHTWSLGVEEQFYLFLPLILGALWRWRKLMWVVIAGLTFASFLAMILMREAHPEANFYLLHSRAWELLLGVIAAKLYRMEIQVGKIAPAIFSALGLMAILLAMFIIPASVMWPSLWTILPVLGTLLVLLFGGAGSLSDRILNLAPLRWIGLISYSAYLWHQPAFSVAKNGSWFTGSPWQSVVLMGITMILATASWRWIEQPFRQQRLGKFWGGTVLVFAALAIFCFAILAHTSKGMPSRLPAQVAEIAAFAESYHPNYRRCLFTRSEVGERDIAQSCQYGDQEPSVAIWGDSHAAALAGPLGDMLALRGVGAIQLTLSSCLPVPGLINNTQSRAERCPEFNAQAVEYLLNSEAINTVVLHASWVSYFKNRSLKTMNGVEEFDHFFAYPTGGQPDMNVQDRRDVVGAVFGDLIFKLQAAGKRVIIVRTAPRPGVRVPELAARSVWREGTIASTPQFAMAYERFNRANPDMLFAELVRNPDINTANLHIMDPHDVFCGSTHCLTHNGEVPYYADGNHLSVPGANQLADHVLRNVID